MAKPIQEEVDEESKRRELEALEEQLKSSMITAATETNRRLVKQTLLNTQDTNESKKSSANSAIQ